MNNKDGFFLLAESGRIDHAHHGVQAHLALDETLALDLAVEEAVRTLGKEAQDTLIIVTADHSHTMSFQGYSSRGNDITGLWTSKMRRVA